PTVAGCGTWPEPCKWAGSTWSAAWRSSPVTWPRSSQGSTTWSLGGWTVPASGPATPRRTRTGRSRSRSRTCRRTCSVPCTRRAPDPLIAPHQVAGRPIAAGAHQLDLVRAAAAALEPEPVTGLTDVRWRAPLQVDGETEARVTLRRDDGPGLAFELTSDPSGT